MEVPGGLREMGSRAALVAELMEVTCCSRWDSASFTTSAG